MVSGRLTVPIVSSGAAGARRQALRGVVVAHGAVTVGTTARFALGHFRRRLAFPASPAPTAGSPASSPTAPRPSPGPTVSSSGPAPTATATKGRATAVPTPIHGVRTTNAAKTALGVPPSAVRAVVQVYAAKVRVVGRSAAGASPVEENHARARGRRSTIKGRQNGRQATAGRQQRPARAAALAARPATRRTARSPTAVGSPI